MNLVPFWLDSSSSKDRTTAYYSLFAEKLTRCAWFKRTRPIFDLSAFTLSFLGLHSLFSCFKALLLGFLNFQEKLRRLLLPKLIFPTESPWIQSLFEVILEASLVNVVGIFLFWGAEACTKSGTDIQDTLHDLRRGFAFDTFVDGF